MKVVIGVMGEGETARTQDVEMGFELGKAIAQHDWVLLSGGRSVGVMSSVNEGAKSAGGFTLAILPTNNKSDGVSEAVDVAVVTAMGSARNNINVLSSDVVVACGRGGAGTLSEIALALKAGRPVVLLSDDEEGKAFWSSRFPSLVHPANSVNDAIALIEKLIAG